MSYKITSSIEQSANTLLCPAEYCLDQILVTTNESPKINKYAKEYFGSPDSNSFITQSCSSNTSTTSDSFNWNFLEPTLFPITTTNRITTDNDVPPTLPPGLPEDDSSSSDEEDNDISSDIPSPPTGLPEDDSSSIDKEEETILSPAILKKSHTPTYAQLGKQEPQIKPISQQTVDSLNKIPQMQSIQFSSNSSSSNSNSSANFSVRPNNAIKLTGNNLENSLTNLLQEFDNPKVNGSTYGVYVVTNEDRLDKTQEFLKKQPKINNSCHIGVSGWHNFDIIAQRNSQLALIFDFNPKNKSFLLDTLQILKCSTTREDFRKNMTAWLRATQTPDTFDGGRFRREPSKQIQFEFSRNGSWLSDDIAFNHIRQLALRNKIVVITEDIRNSDVFEKISTILKTHNMQIDTLYISNINNYMESEKDKADFSSTVNALMQKETILINCPRVLIDDPYVAPDVCYAQISLEQRVMSKNDIEGIQQLFSIPITKNEFEKIENETEAELNRLKNIKYSEPDPAKDKECLESLKHIPFNFALKGL
jgi:hypothetical protein